MTVNESAAPNGAMEPTLISQTIPKAPPEVFPSVTIAPVTARVVAGVATAVTVNAGRGTHWVWISADLSWNDEPMVTYTETRISIDGVQVLADHRGGGGTEAVTFPAPGTHTLVASAVTTDGRVISSDPMSVRVYAPGPPAFTIAAPAAGTTVSLDEAGKDIVVQVTTTSDQYFPLTVSVAWDDKVATGQILRGSTQFQTTVHLASMPLGTRTIAVTVADPDGVGSQKTTSVTCKDISPPQVHVDYPPQNGNIGASDDTGAATVLMHGTAADLQSGMLGGSASVAWALTPTGTRTPAIPVAPGDFRDWTATVPLTPAGFGAHTIYVWATDFAGNTMAAPQTVPVTVISSYTPKTLDERLNDREYLAALLSFTQEQVTLPGSPPTPLDTHTLVGALGQPVDRLSQPLSAAVDQGNREINQLRVPIEVLRAYIAATGTSTTPGAAGDRAYRIAAYTALLAAAGTSYTELRLARGADPAVRHALAARLGIRLSATSPDELDLLLLDSAGPAESVLETVFGLLSTAAGDPLRVPSTPWLLTWRQTALALMWADQDQHPTVPPAYRVLADPDVITTADVVPGPNGDRIRTLLGSRALVLTLYLAALNDARTKAATPADGLTAMQKLALPGVDLAALETRNAQGGDIGADLAALGLTRGGFLLLRKLCRLAATGTVTTDEWNDAMAVLVRAHKESLYPSWRAQESTFVLSPDFFLPGTTAGPTLNAYRVDTQARTDWKATLRNRITQREDLIEANAQAVAAAEQAALPLLRDALLADLAPSTTGNIGEEMSARFFLDVLAGGALRTTRIRQAIESVQSLLSAKRSGELPANHPAAPWILNGPAFSAAWTWMGQKESWQAATQAFLFPERHLDPALLVPATGPLHDLFETVRGAGVFTGTVAAQAASTYLKAMGKTFGYFDTNLNSLPTVPEPANTEIFWTVPLFLAQRLQASGDYQAALDWYRLVYSYDVHDTGKPVSLYSRINTEKVFQPDLSFPPGWTTALNPFALVANRPAPYTRYTLLSVIRCHLDYADAQFTRETDESVAQARTLYVTARRLLQTPALQPQTPLTAGEPALPIPDLDVLRNRAQVQLAKIRQGRNIAGLPRAQGVTAATVVQPTPYRFKTLLERARQLAAQAAQMEAGFLAALEKYDDRSLRLYDAVKGIDLSAAQLGVASSRVQEAHDAVTAATAQKTKADTMITSYAAAIDAPPSRYEQNLLDDYGDMRDIKDHISEANTAIGVAQAASTASSLFGLFDSGGAKAALAVGIEVATLAKGAFELQQNALEAQMQANQLRAGIEQRKDEWRLQQVSAQQDALIAATQVTTARDQVTIAVQEQAVASLQHDQATATLKFLSQQFTNADLYLWMSNTLGGAYRYFLQHATATARLAQAQLAFERAEPAQTLIRNDYWQSPAELTANTVQPDRQGLTGAEQLTTDLAQLDDYSFNSARRRLNLSQTFSLARLMPVEFLEFRRTGTLAFATPMALFDADFPGHYLRLIRQVRTSLVALVPPDRGIRATLYSNGISRVTTGADGTFQDVTVRSDPGVIALTSPVNAGGVFELDVQSDLLLPFESSGVDTTWEFQLPPAANPFDFSNIADLLLTIDYTAAYDDTYRRQQLTRLNADRSRGADCVFSLARDFPDQWYDLNNPADPTARSVTIPLRDVDFPLEIDSLSTAAVAVRLSSRTPVPDTAVTLTHGPSTGTATTTNGIASTRRGNATAWIPLCGPAPTGPWQLTFGSEAAPLFTSGALDDIVLVISWTGQAPAWTP
ncbi:neuraminidase-like domain-containing protein [Streptomyces sp. NRRL B-3229]|uniref:Tc toxin subunit A-related protein n=1 Tax=Streptomyces sp. NRRL B-3229 TaxID=1463836 RepID=UPI0004C15D42|nr:neuraminidase-like domain-containing protein [Streptomyces sp. NRRL B-3229]